MKTRLFGLLVVLAFVVAGCHSTKGDDDSAAAGQEKVDGAEKIPLEVFVMSECPYWSDAWSVVGPLVRDYAQYVDFRMFFIGEESEPGVPSSMHGESEVLGDMYHVCTMKHAPAKIGPLLDCMYGDMDGFPDNFDRCAKEIGLKSALVKACVEGAEGKILLIESFKTSDERGATGSPTIMLNSVEYDGPRTAEGMAGALCELLGDRKPARCADIPVPPKVGLTIVTDKRCEKCAEMVELAPAQFKKVFPGLEVKVMDYSEEAARELVKPLKDTEFRMLPVFIFDDSIKQDAAWEYFEPYLMDIGGLLVLATESTFDPNAEICDNGVDDDNNAKVDCVDDACAQTLACRPEIKGRLDAFVMSQCPYGAMAIKSMPEVLKAFGKDMTFVVHFLVTETFPGQFSSLHGPAEVGEDFRQACAQKYYAKGNKFMDYLLCRAADYESVEWQKCAVNGIDAAVIKKCSEGEEGRQLLSADAKLSESVAVNASPTWVANNRSMFSGINPAEIQTGYCAVNPGLKGCEKPLSAGDPEVPAGACGE